LRRGLTTALTVSLVVTHARAAPAQELADYLELGRERALELEQRRATAGEAQARHTAADRALLPRLRASGIYRRNQREEAALIPVGPEQELEEVVFTPFNEISATAGIDLPIIDVGAWQQRRTAAALAEAADLGVLDVENQVTRRIAEAYYQYVGASALVRSSEAAVEAAAANRDTVATRVEAGLATELELQRAEAQIARAQQTLAEAALAEADAARVLDLLTGLRPSGEPPPLEVDLAPEEPLETWLAGAGRLPQVRAARAQARAESAQARAAQLFYVPSVEMFAEERFTNAIAFAAVTGWSVGVVVEWRFDLASPRLADARREAARAAELQADIALRDAGADIEAAWQRVQALRSRARAATSEAEATARAAEIARGDYPARASQLDVVIAERDALAAEVERIRAVADLAYARAALRIAAGRADELTRKPTGSDG
jgi:outer membrane protein TolC